GPLLPEWFPTGDRQAPVHPPRLPNPAPLQGIWARARSLACRAGGDRGPPNLARRRTPPLGPTLFPPRGEALPQSRSVLPRATLPPSVQDGNFPFPSSGR